MVLQRTVIFSFFPYSFNNAQGYSAIETGFRLVPEFIAMGIFAINYGKIAKIFKTQTLLLVAFGLIVISALMMTQFTSQSSYVFIAVAMFIMGIGMAISIALLGAIMTSGAIKALQSTLSALPNSEKVINDAITQGLISDNMSMILLQTAWAYGFNIAMLGAAISAVIVIIYLFIQPNKI